MTDNFNLETLNEYHSEIVNYIKSKCLREEDEISWQGNPAVFVKFPTIYYGRLGAPGVEPGQYIDRAHAVISSLGTLYTVKLEEIDIAPEIFKPRLATLTLFPFWFLIDLQGDKVGELPETPFIEGDVVRLTSEHPQYTGNPSEDQFTVNRINFEKKEFKLKGKSVIRSSSDYLEKVSEGPVSIYYNGEQVKLRWRSVKDEAEFYALLGRYSRVFNASNKSYFWDEAEARQVISLGKAHALLKTDQGFSLITFWDQEVGSQATYYDDLILTI